MDSGLEAKAWAASGQSDEKLATGEELVESEPVFRAERSVTGREYSGNEDVKILVVGPSAPKKGHRGQVTGLAETAQK